ncbi:hypothetical protein NliqN6_6618 [Naganishia liquefaciens]|uniref:Uncharacterized protein n=1 Tax=Naganishia liquefaciens TaxID=104408 RepID=A0A8H3U0B4_9TREE|nr:hypothetical protein NliqN6_6618 [Naganishia liquefaciens]
MKTSGSTTGERSGKGAVESNKTLKAFKQSLNSALAKLSMEVTADPDQLTRIIQKATLFEESDVSLEEADEQFMNGLTDTAIGIYSDHAEKIAIETNPELRVRLARTYINALGGIGHQALQKGRMEIMHKVIVKVLPYFQSPEMHNIKQMIEEMALPHEERKRLAEIAELKQNRHMLDCLTAYNASLASSNADKKKAPTPATTGSRLASSHSSGDDEERCSAGPSLYR